MIGIDTATIRTAGYKLQSYGKSIETYTGEIMSHSTQLANIWIGDDSTAANTKVQSYEAPLKELAAVIMKIGADLAKFAEEADAKIKANAQSWQ